MNKDRRNGYLALGIVSLVWGTSYTASKIGNSYMPAIFMAALRQFIAGAILTAFFLLRRYALPNRSELKKIFIQSIFLLVLGNGLVTWSMEFISSGLASIIAALTPLFIAFFSILSGKYARITGWMFAGLLMGLTGIGIIFYDYLGQIQNSSFLVGTVLSLLSVIAWSFGSVYSARQQISINTLFNVALQLFFSGSLLLAVSFLFVTKAGVAGISAAGWYALLYLILAGSLLGYTAYVFALSKLPPTLVSVYAYITPVVAVLLGCTLLGEKLTAHILLGTLVILYSVYLVNREFTRLKSGAVNRS